MSERETTLETREELFGKFPEWKTAFWTTVATLEKLTPTQYEDEQAVACVGDVLIQHVRALQSIEPYKSDWQKFATHWRNVRAEFRGEPMPYDSFEKLVQKYNQEWVNAPLKNSSIFTIVKTVLESQNLWTNEVIKTLVIYHFFNRCYVDCYDLAELNKLYLDKIPQGRTINPEESKKLVVYVSESSAEMRNKRKIDFIENASTGVWKFDRNFYPADLVLMDKEMWEKLFRTPRGKQLDLFSTVYCLTDFGHTRSDKSDWAQRLNKLLKTALASYLKDPLYQEYVANPTRVTIDALKEFAAVSS